MSNNGKGKLEHNSLVKTRMPPSRVLGRDPRDGVELGIKARRSTEVVRPVRVARRDGCLQTIGFVARVCRFEGVECGRLYDHFDVCRLGKQPLDEATGDLRGDHIVCYT